MADSKFCTENHKTEIARLNGGRGRPYFEYFEIFHYSRSLEKFAIKGRTWKTASGEVRPGESDAQAAKSYDIPKFLSRNVGWFHDNSAVRFGCQLREHIKKVSNVSTAYLR